MFRKLLLAGLVALPGWAQAQVKVPPPPPPQAQAVPRPAAGDSAKPAWIEILPQAPGRLYALGTAELGASEGAAIARAADRARLEVVTRLRATVRGSTSVTTRTSEGQQGGGKAAGSGDRQVRDEVNVGAQAEDLPGLVVERTFADPPGRTAYALAFLDLGLARDTLAARLEQLRDTRVRVGDELSRKARWRLRKVQEDLNRLDETIGLLAVTGAGLDLRPALQTERAAVEKRLGQMEGKALPPLDLARTTMGLRSNVTLPLGVAAYLEAQIGECGLVHRDLNPDLILDLTFSGGSQGPEFIFADMDIYQGVSYRLEVQMTILAGGTAGLGGRGTALTRSVPIQVSQSDSPEGMVEQFRRQFERRLPKLVADVVNELQ